MRRKRKFLSLGVCLVVVVLLASLITGCAGPSDGNGNGNGNGDEDGEPIYGGVLNVLVTQEPIYFDDAIGSHYSVTSVQECLWSGNWARGPAGGYGSDDTPWIVVSNQLSDKTGYIAESYEIHDDYLIFNLRPGVKWHDQYPCNGREVTPDDVVFSFERQMTLDTAYLKKSYPHVAAAMDVYEVDEDTVRIDCDPAQMPELLTMIDYIYIYPRDAVELYGDMNDWENSIGTGAFTLEEYVEGSHLYYERNDDWWMTYPVIGSPSDGDELPYLDGFRIYIQPDYSTGDALFTTGQVDRLLADTTRAQSLIDLPGVQYRKYLETATTPTLFVRMDKEGQPWSDIRVRQAMQLAIDNQQIIDGLYGGDGEILCWPIWDTPEVEDAYVSLAELADDMIEVDHDDAELPDEISVADLFGHDVELAQALMDKAGYGAGFTAEVVCLATSQFQMDNITAVKAMLADINITLELNPMDYASWTTQWATGGFNDMFIGAYSGVGTYFKGINWSGPSMFNGSQVDDPVLNDYRDQMLEAYPDEAAVDVIHTEMIPYLLEQCYAIQTAGCYSYNIWHAWVKNYTGEGGIGYYKTIGVDRNAFIWVDEDLKEDMGF
jgi:peptide/nickel transport system substrate-binding protein